MKKTFSLIILSLMIVSMIGAVSAVEYTLIAGKIYNADFSDVIEGADVTVTCVWNGVPTVKNAVSLVDGSYSVQFIQFEMVNDTLFTECKNGADLTVSAVKGDLYGSQTGVIHNEAFGPWDLAIVNVPLVPEFGLIVGMVTILGAIGVFFVVRRK